MLGSREILFQAGCPRNRQSILEHDGDEGHDRDPGFGSDGNQDAGACTKMRQHRGKKAWRMDRRSQVAHADGENVVERGEPLRPFQIESSGPIAPPFVFGCGHPCPSDATTDRCRQAPAESCSLCVGLACHRFRGAGTNAVRSTSRRNPLASAIRVFDQDALERR